MNFDIFEIRINWIKLGLYKDLNYDYLSLEFFLFYDYGNEKKSKRRPSVEVERNLM